MFSETIVATIPRASLSLVNRFNLNVFRYERQFFATLRTFAIATLNNLIWRLQLYPFVKNSTAFLTNYPLRHDLTAFVKRRYNRCKLFIHSDL